MGNSYPESHFILPMHPHRIFVDSYLVATKDLASLFEDAIHSQQIAQVLSISTIGNVWEPVRRWSKAESRVLRNSPSSLNRVSVGDLLSLGELYGFWVIRWEATKLTPFNTDWLPVAPRKIMRKLPLLKHLAKDVRIGFYREASHISPQAPKKVSIVIPARNEAGNEGLLREAIDTILAQLTDVEIILVEGNSTDNTYEMLKQIERDYTGRGDLRLLQQDGKGKKNAVVCGFNGCKGDILAIIDCDFTVDVSDSVSAIKHASQRECCMINCARTIYPMEKDAMRWANYLGNRAFALLVSFLSGQTVSDALCGTKIFTRAMYDQLMTNGTLLSPRDPFGDFALIFGASNLDYRVLNYPVRYYARRSGAPNISRWKDGLKLLMVCWHQLLV